jgi:predicted RNase H-like HicB family nuclease
MENRLRQYEYSVLLDPDEEGVYTVTVPALPGIVTQGETVEEALAMAREAIRLYLEDLVADGEPDPHRARAATIGESYRRGLKHRARHGASMEQLSVVAVKDDVAHQESAAASLLD